MKTLEMHSPKTNVTRNGSCQHACAICLLEVVPNYTVPEPETEVQLESASCQGTVDCAHLCLGQLPKPENSAAQTRDPGLVALILA